MNGPREWSGGKDERRNSLSGPAEQGWLNNIAGPVKDIPEFHDCQKFIVQNDAGQLQYTELFAIFARFKLDSVLGGLDSTPQAIQDTSPAVTVAEIYAEGTYRPLDISERFSCVILYSRHSQWHAKVVPKSAMGTACMPNVNPDLFPIARELEVRRTMVGTFPDSAYPPVTRWDWDSVNLEQYMGFKCGRAWCEAGDANFVQSASYVMPTAWPAPERWVRMIKGWYDEQILGDTAGATRPIGVLGSIFPDAQLGRRNAPTDFPGWTDIAHVVLHGKSPEYTKKRAFEPGTPQAPRSHIRFCYGDITSCGPVQGAALVSCPNTSAWNTLAASLPQRMHVMFVGQSNLVIPSCAHRREPKSFPTGYQIPATVRWRWTTSDETAWGRCGTGCCVPH